MNLFEITVGQLVMPSSLFTILGVYPQEPLAVLEKTVLIDELFLDLRRGMVVAPRVPLVVDKFTLLDKSFGVFICALVQFYGHVEYLLTEVRLENGQRLPN